MITIRLRFKNSLIAISGREFGKDVYKNQIKNYLVEKEQVLLEFPDNIEAVASSFPQGLFSEELEKIGYEGVRKRYSVHSNVDGFVENFWESFE
ncbi:TPA: DUF4325 domain-containing protein [Streptococcus suis]|uniref:STAS-like domain-containing protein n=1 Tax=Streptococcus suis TaxID=1307 RepID=UPI000CF68747|nr:DUF4325 domain-containing protein [Streptococcus suis]MBO3756510.1 DUF4325 domain-containing protein [Streptococcus suis]